MLIPTTERSPSADRRAGGMAGRASDAAISRALTGHAGA
jgi:hypothetical protein